MKPRREVPGERDAAEELQKCRDPGGTGQHLPAACSGGSCGDSRGRSHSCRIRQREAGEAELASPEQPKAQPGLSFPGERRAGAGAERSAVL